jgi:hypothetical protein
MCGPCGAANGGEEEIVNVIGDKSRMKENTSKKKTEVCG